MAWKNARVVLSAGVIGFAGVIGLATAAQAAPLYFQGFETNPNGWHVDGGGAIASTASGGGVLGLTAFDGSHYGETTNATDAYQPGYGTGGFSALNGNGTTPTAYPGSSFSQSISIYIDTSTPAPANPSVPAFWVDMTPDALTPDGAGCDPFACSDEHNFQLFYSGSDVKVGTDGHSPTLTITKSGWYTFQDTYSKGPTGGSLVQTDENVYDSSNTLLGSTAYVANSDGATLDSDNLGGPGYIWLPVWQNGFSNNVLGIDDVRADTVPEPSTLTILMSALLGLGTLQYFRRHSHRV